MNNQRIIFIANSLTLQRVIKRINSFVDAGYNIDVYGFIRSDVGYYGNLERNFSFNVIGEFPNSMSYFKRLFIIRKSIKRILSSIPQNGSLLYLFGLETAIVVKRLTKIPYIYEEADLVHTYIGNPIIRLFLEKEDISIIRKSKLTVLTSEGFISYHFGKKKPHNVLVVGNRLNPSVNNLPKKGKKCINIDHLRIGFVGSFRFESIIHFCKVFLKNYPQHELHVYGVIADEGINRFFEEYDNFFYHGPFKNPDDLPEIYSNIDLSLSTYDATTINAKFAEPNKMYEALYFETPIIVSKGTYLENKVKNLGIGFSVDAFNDDEIKSFINSLSAHRLNECIDNLRLLDKEAAINNMSNLFNRVDDILS